MNKNKNIINNVNKAGNIGMYMMSIASIAGIMELPSHYLKDTFITPPKYATVANPTSKDNPDPIQREKEEIGEQYVSYAESQRTPGRAGKY